MDLAGQNIIVFDLEIKEEIDGKNVTWGTPEKMGISVGVAYDYLVGDYHVYLDDNLHELHKRINSADMVVGFYTEGFDLPLLRATKVFGDNGGEIIPVPLRTDNSYDILYWSRRSIGWKDGQRFPSGMKLNDHLASMFGMQKTEDGAQAPVFYKQGKMGKLISYCLADVARERKVFEHIWNLGWLKTAAHGQRNVECPKKMLRGWQDARNQNKLP